MVRDLVLYAHIIIGIALVILPILIISQLKKRNPSSARTLSLLTATLSWLLLIPAGYLYIIFYPATKTLILAGTSTWAHEIVMETKEHWGILLPMITTVATFLVYNDKFNESKKWWVLTAILSLLIGIMGRIIVMGAGL